MISSVWFLREDSQFHIGENSQVLQTHQNLIEMILPWLMVCSFLQRRIIFIPYVAALFMSCFVLCQYFEFGVLKKIIVCIFKLHTYLFTLPEHLSPPPVFRVARSLVLYVVFCWSLLSFSVGHCICFFPFTYSELFSTILCSSHWKEIKYN